jgi:DNA-directed RNA polymerase specialized sigma24 family protein
LFLRSFEGLTNEEAGQILGIEPKTASKRYTRSLLRLRKLLLAGGIQGPEP